MTAASGRLQLIADTTGDRSISPTAGHENKAPLHTRAGITRLASRTPGILLARSRSNLSDVAQPERPRLFIDNLVVDPRWMATPAFAERCDAAFVNESRFTQVCCAPAACRVCAFEGRQRARMFAWAKPLPAVQAVQPLLSAQPAVSAMWTPHIRMARRGERVRLNSHVPRACAPRRIHSSVQAAVT